jgi:pimeloyl-ACP methyl ester carboxylesterase
VNAGVTAQDLGLAAHSRYAEVNGIRLHYVEAGAGPLLVFLHGFPDAWFGWRAAITEFARDHRVVCPDQRGYNLSDKPEGVKAYRPVELVEDLRQLIDHLGGRCTLVAHDWGGAIAWNFAAQHPDRLERLVIVNAPHPVLYARDLAKDPAQQRASEYMLRLRSDGAEQALAANGYAGVIEHFEGWSGTGQALSPSLLETYRRAWSVPGALTAMLNWYRASPLRPTCDGALYAALRERAA